MRCGNCSASVDLGSLPDVLPAEPARTAPETTEQSQVKTDSLVPCVVVSPGSSATEPAAAPPRRRKNYGLVWWFLAGLLVVIWAVILALWLVRRNATTVTVDTYPGRRFTARIESIGAATGAEFSVLPPQNATGNWVKVTQRLPVRVVIADSDPRLPLRAGMSVTVEVDTAYRRPALALIESAFAGSPNAK